jgi:DNA-binding Xre family transcriptional regulator
MGMKRTLAEILRLKGWTNYRLSLETGISQQVLSNWARKGAKHVGLRQLVQLKRGSGLSWSKIGELLEGELESGE